MKVGTFGVNWVTNNIDPRRGEEKVEVTGGGGSDGGGDDSGRFESRLHAEDCLLRQRFCAFR